MKRLHSFTITKDVEVLKKEESENDKGEKVITEKTVTENKDQYFFIRKPTRALYDEAELFYAVKMSEGIKAGLLTKALLAKRYENDGGPLSETEVERYGSLYVDFYQRQSEYFEIMDKDEDKRTEVEKEKILELEEVLKGTRQILTQFELEQQSLYEQTAEVRARNKTILWWILNLAYSEDDKGTQTSVFGGGTYDERLTTYDDLAERDDNFWEKVIQRFTYFVSFWFVGRVNNEEEFKQLLDEQGIGQDLENMEVDEDGEVGIKGGKTKDDLPLEKKPEPEPEPEPESEPEPEAESNPDKIDIKVEPEPEKEEFNEDNEPKE